MIPPIGIGPLGAGEWSVGGVDPLGAAGQLGADAGASTVGSSGSSFGSALTGAIDSLEQGQAAGTNAAQALATGTLADPTQAVTAVENASLQMQLASQLRTKLVDVTSSIFQTQA